MTRGFSEVPLPIPPMYQDTPAQFTDPHRQLAYYTREAMLVKGIQDLFEVIMYLPPEDHDQQHDQRIELIDKLIVKVRETGSFIDPRLTEQILSTGHSLQRRLTASPQVQHALSKSLAWLEDSLDGDSHTRQGIRRLLLSLEGIKHYLLTPDRRISPPLYQQLLVRTIGSAMTIAKAERRINQLTTQDPLRLAPETRQEITNLKYTIAHIQNQTPLLKIDLFYYHANEIGKRLVRTLREQYPYTPSDEAQSLDGDGSLTRPMICGLPIDPITLGVALFYTDGDHQAVESGHAYGVSFSRYDIGLPIHIVDPFSDTQYTDAEVDRLDRHIYDQKKIRRSTTSPNDPSTRLQIFANSIEDHIHDRLMVIYKTAEYNILHAIQISDKNALRWLRYEPIRRYVASKIGEDRDLQATYAEEVIRAQHRAQGASSNTGMGIPLAIGGIVLASVVAPVIGISLPVTGMFAATTGLVTWANIQSGNNALQANDEMWEVYLNQFNSVIGPAMTSEAEFQHQRFLMILASVNHAIQLSLIGAWTGYNASGIQKVLTLPLELYKQRILGVTSTGIQSIKSFTPTIISRVISTYIRAWQNNPRYILHKVQSDFWLNLVMVTTVFQFLFEGSNKFLFINDYGQLRANDHAILNILLPVFYGLIITPTFKINSLLGRYTLTLGALLISEPLLLPLKHTVSWGHPDIDINRVWLDVRTHAPSYAWFELFVRWPTIAWENAHPAAGSAPFYPLLRAIHKIVMAIYKSNETVKDFGNTNPSGPIDTAQSTNWHNLEEAILEASQSIGRFSHFNWQDIFEAMGGCQEDADANLNWGPTRTH